MDRPPSALDVKICGLRDEAALDAALDAGADWVGLVLFPPSPRHLDLDIAYRLADRGRGRAGVVVLLVDPDDALVDAVAVRLRPDLVQLHGREAPDRAAAIRARTGRPVMKAIGIAERADLMLAQTYANVADRLLLDAKPLKGATRPGGNGVAFDWAMVHGFAPGVPWMLSGGLSSENVGEALRISGASAVDVSSGVERAPGVKDADLIHRFVAAARGAGSVAGPLPVWEPVAS